MADEQAHEVSRLRRLLREVYNDPTVALGYGVVEHDPATGVEISRTRPHRWRLETQNILAGGDVPVSNPGAKAADDGG